MTGEPVAVKAGKVALSGPQGPRPWRWWAPGRIFVYSVLIAAALFYLFPLYVVLVMSFKDLDEIRYSSIFALPVRPTLAGWNTAWNGVCTGLTCEGLKVNFWNSVKVTVPSVVLSIFWGSVCGYTLALWRFRGADFFFTAMIFTIFIPPLTILYPMAQLAGFLKLMGTFPGAVLINSIVGVPFMTLLFRNGFAALPPELFRAARVDGAGFWRIYAEVLMPLLLPIIGVAVVLQVTYIWSDFLFTALFGGADYFPMTRQYHNLVNSMYGVAEYNVQMAATILTGAVPLTVYFLCGRFFMRGLATGVLPRRR